MMDDIGHMLAFDERQSEVNEAAVAATAIAAGYSPDRLGGLVWGLRPDLPGVKRKQAWDLIALDHSPKRKRENLADNPNLS
jgi:hypothetical protein